MFEILNKHRVFPHFEIGKTQSKHRWGMDITNRQNTLSFSTKKHALGHRESIGASGLHKSLNNIVFLVRFFRNIKKQYVFERFVATEAAGLDYSGAA